MIQIDRAEHPCEQMTGEQRLFVSVILSAVREAVGRLQAGDDRRRGAKSQKQALEWFREAGDDFKEVCLYAGLDPDCVQSGVLAYVEEELAQTVKLKKRVRSRGGGERVH
ncbi:hypothetical protein GCM10022253_06870 [Sphingomonas endophytica]|uniref:Uncharacterized protein n=1 Tax=Sphingomonas endophytica TaxID=869719 RepID=A0ABR6N0R7_9SPHN|nr:hypothetical protein [Sphingomonas endophytica]MBB5724378.1 hypothetical protein [Sphingomonas endophytica]